MKLGFFYNLRYVCQPGTAKNIQSITKKMPFFRNNFDFFNGVVWGEKLISTSQMFISISRFRRAQRVVVQRGSGRIRGAGTDWTPVQKHLAT